MSKEEKIKKSVKKIHKEATKIEEEVAPKIGKTYGDPIVQLY